MEDSPAVSWYQSVVLGLVQGVTEFLPISSSAHLILVPRLFGWADQGLVTDIAANTGTLIAVAWYFRTDLRGLAGVISARGRGRTPVRADERALIWMLLASLPIAAAGWWLRDYVASDGRDPRLIAVTLIGFGLLLGVADLCAGPLSERLPWFGRRRGTASLRLRDAIVIGAAQALALIPGTSRSGVTMTAGLFAGFDRETAARISFLLALPVGVMAALADGVRLFSQPVAAAQILDLGLVILVSAVTGYAVIAWLLAWVRRRSLMVFVVYRLALGLVLLWLLGSSAI